MSANRCILNCTITRFKSVCNCYAFQCICGVCSVEWMKLCRWKSHNPNALRKWKRMTWNIERNSTVGMQWHDVTVCKQPTKFVCAVHLHIAFCIMQFEGIFVIRLGRWAFARQFGRCECLNIKEWPKKHKVYAICLSEKREREEKTALTHNNRNRNRRLFSWRYTQMPVWFKCWCYCL